MLVQHALACPHRNRLTCSNFRAALKAHLAHARARSGRAAREKGLARVKHRLAI
jgi:hypothetical protein